MLGYIAFGVFALGCLTVAWWYQAKYHELKQENKELQNALIEEVKAKL